MEHLNFCRALVKQCSEILTAPSLSALARAELSHAMDLCRASRKFMLPDGGKMLYDAELRGLDETQKLRLPYPFIALEYRATGTEFRDKMPKKSCIRRIIFARESEYGIVITTAVCWDSNGAWGLLGDCFVPDINYLDRSRSDSNGAPWINFNRPVIGSDQDYLEEISTVLAFLSALQCSNVHINRSEPKKSGKKIKSALPFDAYHILTIDVPGRSTDGAGIGGPHRSPREHLRRGHIRRLADGRRIWVNATLVAAGRGGGVVNKDYAVRCAA